MDLSMNRRQQYFLWCVLLAILVVTLIVPAGNGAIRLLTVGLAIALWLGIAWLWRNWKAAIGGWLVVTLFSGLFLLLPGAPADPNTLRVDYINSLKTYGDTKYIWGGENHWGIDCSGLIRQGLIRANFLRGIQSANPALVRSAFSMWWFDASAESLKDGYRQWTKPLFAAESINGIAINKLLPGDLAVTADGLHILAYIGDSQWIEADPGILKVITVKVPEPNNRWFQVPVKIVRWQQLV
jgi:NlpC/P60 family